MVYLTSKLCNIQLPNNQNDTKKQTFVYTTIENIVSNRMINNCVIPFARDYMLPLTALGITCFYTLDDSSIGSAQLIASLAATALGTSCAIEAIKKVHNNKENRSKHLIQGMIWGLTGAIGIAKIVNDFNTCQEDLQTHIKIIEESAGLGSY